MVPTFKHIASKESTWAFYVNFETQKNTYVQLFATRCVFQPLLRGLRQTSTERFVKPTITRDLCS